MRAMLPTTATTATVAPQARLANPVAQGWLDVGEGHRVYFEDHGRPDALPVLILHGGPGSGSTPRHREFFAAEHYRCVQFDQRGCGRSEPAGRVIANDTQALIADIEQLRLHLGIDRWLVFGGSWGAALALAYAGRHRSRVLGVLLRACFLTGQDEIEAFFTGTPEQAPLSRAALFEALGGAANLAEAQVAAALQARFAVLDPSGEPMAAALNPDLARLAWCWQAYEGALDGGSDGVRPLSGDMALLRRLVVKYRVQAHYLARACFLGERAVLDAAAQLPGLPVALVHGTADAICPPQNALRVLEACPGARLAWADAAGHHPWQGATPRLLRRASEVFAADGDFESWPGEPSKGTDP